VARCGLQIASSLQLAQIRTVRSSLQEAKTVRPPTYPNATDPMAIRGSSDGSQALRGLIHRDQSGGLTRPRSADNRELVSDRNP
jgi:hypothetical protein